jgi:membrane fusion protein (multidrug efflux system)
VVSDIEGFKANIELATTGEDLARIKTSQMEAQEARVVLAKELVKQAELNLSYTRITSPVRGFVTKKKVETGQMVSKGQPIMAIVPLSLEDMWVTANFKETQITNVKAGQEVIIRVDTYPDAKIQGKVDSIMAGTGATFSLFPPENATGNFVKVVQRIPVKIVFNTENLSDMPDLRIGMSAVPIIYTR